MAIVGALVGVLSLTALPAGANHARNSYCSESGDVCAGARKEDGKRILQLATVANYFDTYKVCVTTPDGAKTCRNGTMRDGDGDGIFVGRMTWVKQFPNGGPGEYYVRWTSGDSYRSPRLGFHKN
jgi:hypothetical protein